MAAGCDEKLDKEFVWWILWESRVRRKREWYRSVAEKYRDKAVVLRNQRELDAFMRGEGLL